MTRSARSRGASLRPRLPARAGLCPVWWLRMLPCPSTPGPCCPNSVCRTP